MFVIERNGSHCNLNVFTINGLKACIEDFGEVVIKPLSISHQRQYVRGCGKVEFKRTSPEEEILKTFGITIEEYNEICNKLEEELQSEDCTDCD